MNPRKKKILSKYYLLIFPPYVISMIVLNLVEVDLWNLILFTLGFSWQVVLKAPFIKERVERKSYRYSFIRLIYLSDSFFGKLGGYSPNLIKNMFLRAFSPFLYGSTLVICVGYGSIPLLVLGIVLSEILLFKRNSTVY